MLSAWDAASRPGETLTAAIEALASAPASFNDWLASPVPANTFQKGLDDLSSKSAAEAGQTVFDTAVGGAAILAAGGAWQWIGGKWVRGEGTKGNGSETPYNPQTTRNELESTYGRDNVLSTTVPPVDGRNVHLAGKRHPVTGVVFDNRGFPIFDDVAAFDTRISIDAFKSASYEGQMKLATKDLLGAIQQGQVKASSFTAKQLQQINAGAKKIDGYTWHHHQDSGRMQLVPELIHSKTGHIGGEAMGGGM